MKVRTGTHQTDQAKSELCLMFDVRNEIFSQDKFVPEHQRKQANEYYNNYRSIDRSL